MPLTWEHHLDQVSLVDVVGGGEPLQDILRVQVMAKEHDLVVHAKKSTFWKLLPDKDIERGNIITVSFSKVYLIKPKVKETES